MKVYYFSFILLVSAVFFSFESNAQEVTYTEDIAEIIYNKCSVCHRPGEIGPMSLTNYEEVKNWANTIKYVTAIKYMPPWKADPEYSQFLGENYLTDEEIQKITDWVDTGAEQGNVSLEPAYPIFPEGSALGEPDLVLSFEQSHIHKGNNTDEYRYFVLPTGLTEDKVVKALEMRPGNKKIVHHALFFEDRSGDARRSDASTPEYGFEGFGGFSTGSEIEILTSKQYPGYAPGQKAAYFQDGLGQVLHAGADLVVQMHYAPWAQDERDSSTVNLFFADDNEIVDRYVESHIMVPLGNVLLNGPFFINANQIKQFHGVWTVPKDISILGIFPHMHLLGQDWEVYMESPDGTIEPLISIPDWDFNWQSGFQFPEFKVAKRGTKIHALATYDNTAENPSNPSNPPRWVSWGEKTTDEMYYLPISYVDYNEGDEDVIFSDGTTSLEDIGISEHDNKIYPISPNPVQGMTNVGFSINRAQPLNISIVDINGKLIRELKESEFYSIGKHIINFRADHLASGIYFMKVTGHNFTLSEKFVKQ